MKVNFLEIRGCWRDVADSAGTTINKEALLNSCPPFFRGEEVSNDVINSDVFVGYAFKKSLLYVQQAIIIYNMFYAK